MGTGKRKRLPPMPPGEVAEIFSRWYDTDYWQIKKETLVAAIENFEINTGLLYNTPLLKNSRRQVETQWKAELHLAAFHCAEALFMLMLAVKEEGLGAWHKLPVNQKPELESFVQDIHDGADNPEEGLTRDDLQGFFFSGIDPTEEGEEMVEAMEETLDFLEGYLPRLARFFKDKNVYNAFKHGNRITRVQSKIEMGDDLETDQRDVFLFIDTEPQQDKQPPRYVLRSQHIEYELAQRIIDVNTVLMENLLTGYRTALTDAEEADYKTILNARAEELFQTDTGQAGIAIPDLSFGMRIDHDAREQQGETEGGEGP